MIVIVETCIGHTTKWCITCIKTAGPADAMICAQCRGYVVTTYTCPKCQTERYFYGDDTPERCSCGYSLPDLNMLKEEQGARQAFHTEVDID